MVNSRPARHGFATFTAFVLAGAAPLVPYLFPRPISAAVGRARVGSGCWWTNGQEMLGLGVAVGVAAFVVGGLVASLVRRR